jgi:hypothetical protein
MADPPSRRDTAGVGADRASPPRMPRWVKMSLLLAAALVLLVAVVMLLAGGGHGPSRHASGIQSLSISVTADLTLSAVSLGVYTPSKVNHR